MCICFSIDIRYKFYLLLGHINRAIGKLDVAIAHYQDASKLAKSTEDISDPTVLPFIYHQLCIYAGGDNSGPLIKLTPLIDMDSSLCIPTRVVLLQALGNIYRSAADWHKSTSHFKKAIQLAKISGDIGKAMECKAELGRAYRSSGCHSKALKRQKKLLEFAQGRSDTSNVANACGYIGFTYYSMGKQHYDEAVKYLSCKLELCKNELDDSAGYRWCLNNIGKVYLGLKEHDLCMKLFSESGEIARQLGNLLGLGTAYGNLGSACRAVGKHGDSVKYHQLYLEIAIKNSDTGGVAIMQRELILDHLYLYRDEGDAGKKASFLAQAEIYAFGALRTSLEVRSRLSNEDDILKIGNFEHNQAKIFSLLLFIAIEQGQYEAGLVLSELGRAHALADRINDKFEVNSSFLSDVLNIIGSNDQISPSALSAVLKKIGMLVSGSKSQVLVYSILENPLHKGKETMLYTWHVQSDHKIGVQVHFKQSVISLTGIDSGHSAIDEDYISGLMRDVQLCEAEATQPIIRPEYQPDLDKVSVPLSRDIIRKKHIVSQAFQPKRDKLEELYDLLITPMSQFICDCQSTRLVIIPHGFLFSVPFCALKTGGTYLIEKFVICVSPSLYILDIGLQREKEWSKLPSSRDDIKVFAVGNPKMPVDELEHLPGAEEEVESIALLSQSTELLCGEYATKRAVVSGFHRHSVIHLATHAIVAASLSDLIAAAESDSEVKPYNVGDYSVKGAIILARSDSSCSGVLTSSEIEKLRLEPSCELVVLSCCNSGCGKITGDGILGLSRSLMCAGVMNMLVTLWPIVDKSTPLLMKQFYTHYAVNRDAPAALQFSMLHLIKQHYNVRQWAAFCCIGTKYIGTNYGLM